MGQLWPGQGCLDGRNYEAQAKEEVSCFLLARCAGHDYCTPLYSDFCVILVVLFNLAV